MKVKTSVWAYYSEFSKDWNYTSHDADMSKVGWIKVSDHEIEFDELPRDVLVNGTIDAFRAEQQRIRAEAEVKAQNIEAQIQELLCIEDKSK